MEHQFRGECNRRGARRSMPMYTDSSLRRPIPAGKPMSRIAVLLLPIALVAGAAQASQQGVLVLKNWKGMDNCTKTAQTAFPDFTAEANAKRDAMVKDCLARQNFAPREPASPGH
jgi:hypothetical protein